MRKVYEISEQEYKQAEEIRKANNNGTIIFWWANKKIWRTQLKNCIIILDKNTIKGGSPYE
ncbi:hypothetical protein FL857_02715 [Criibacterium bergeronii]|uniref:Uncharacterized protein n=1 Tax=Criibacterium bergeronii TaxID=1871336 RepID=A0A552VBR9_9FIRM|nr:hypothetical protein [Criibacterium bergeronii]TRW27923.1 hypothetical protein FL857_02715 [Criibacterium bergeronii]